MRTWTELWVSVVIQWVAGAFGAILVARLAGDKRADPWFIAFMLFFLLIVFVNEVIKDLHKRLEDLGHRSEQMEDTLDELDRWRRIQMGEAEESDLEP